MAVVENPKILAIDTSSMTGSVALCHGDVVLAESLINVRSTHSERLLAQVEQVLDLTGTSLADLDCLAVVQGPGSFTGLRVGLATAKGLATANSTPVIGLSSLDVLAANLSLCPYPVCAFLDARKQEVYSCLYDCRDGFPTSLDEERVLPPEEVLRRLEGEVALVGDGVALYLPLIQELLGDRGKLPTPVLHQPRASVAAALARQRFAKGQLLSAEDLKPCYIRPSDADLPKSKGGSAAG